MKIELTTSGGLTGRGIGSVTIDAGTQLTLSEQQRLASLPKPKKTHSPQRAPDAITYTLRIDGEEWTWTDVNAPKDCQAWSDVLLAIRERIAHPSSSM
ncbi:MAG TPA: hypothetical protein VGK04_09370 [Thermoanaerobaculia bacterium]|jgi:hypothetical protein